MDRCVNRITSKFASLFGICTGENLSAGSTQTHSIVAVAQWLLVRLADGRLWAYCARRGVRRGRETERTVGEIKPRSA